jgi:hypothetical protein
VKVEDMLLCHHKGGRLLLIIVCIRIFKKCAVPVLRE